MYDCKITVMRQTHYVDLSAAYENPIPHPCDLRVGQCFVSHEATKPEGMCDSAWQTLQPFVMALACGATGLYDGWMRNPRSAMLSCNDGFRPVTFLVEALPMDDAAEPGA
ncbi:MAG: TIGR04076 family protein [Bacteroidales bacterium]|nr:TIGR04076 family protein [Bacteroidales bacterium]